MPVSISSRVVRQGTAIVLGCLCSLSSVALSAEIRVTVENLSPAGGVFFTPVWVAFHDGNFDIGSLGSSAGNGLERLAEDGATDLISAEFNASPAGSNGGVDGTILAPGGLAGPPVFDPGEKVTQTFSVDPSSSRYFLYASMIIPSNDAFFAELEHLGEEIFDATGNFKGRLEILILGRDVLDAGTEVNTELDAAFLNQLADNTGETESGLISLHPGFNGSFGNPGGVSRVLGGTNGLGVTIDPIAADFTLPDYVVARIVVVPEVPPAAMLTLVGSLIIGLRLLSRRWIAGA